MSARRFIMRALRIGRDKSGVAAVEFALILPVMLTLFLGLSEVTRALQCKSNVADMASTAADLITQETTVTNSDISDVMGALGAILYPFPTSTAGVVITSVIENGTNGYKVAWSTAQNATARNTGSAVTVPAGLVTPGGSVILVEVTYKYSSIGSSIIKAPITMTSSFWAKPRKAAQITRS